MMNQNKADAMKPLSETANPLLVLLFSLAVAVLLFFFLTSGIPLMQLGLIRDWGPGKKKYLAAAREAVLGLGLLLVFLRWKLPQVFESLWTTRFFRFVLSLPLKTVLWALFFFATIVFSWVSCLRHLALESRAFDLGIFVQAVWTTLHGHFLFSSLKGDICLLGDHVSPLLAVLAVPYAFWSDPRLLLVLQAAATAACVFPLAAFVEKKFLDKRTALIFVLMYLFFTPTRAALHEDFHPEVLVKPFFFLAFIWLEEGRHRLFLLALALILSAKENLAGVTFAFGLYAVLFKKERSLGWFVMIFSLAYLFFAIHWIVPHFSGQPYLYRGFYDHLAKNGPAGFWGLLTDGARWEYVLKVYGPFLFLPFFDPPVLLLTLPVLLQNLLADNPVLRSFNYHYMTGLSPFLKIATATALFKFRLRFSWVRRYFHWICAGLLWAFLLQSGAPEYFYGWESAKKITPRTRMIREQLAAIPPERRVLTHNNLIPQTANRMGLYQFDYRGEPTKTNDALRYKADVVVLDKEFWEPSTRPMKDEIPPLRAAGYAVAFEKDGFLILHRPTSSTSD